MPRKKSNKKKKKDAKERHSTPHHATPPTPPTPTPTPTPHKTSPNAVATPPIAKRQLFASSPTLKSSTKHANHQALRLLNLVNQWNDANKEGTELMAAVSGLTGRLAALQRLASIHPSARNDVLALFEGLQPKVQQRHIEDLEDVFHNLRILLSTFDELATAFRDCSAELQLHLHRVQHDASNTELSLLFAVPTVEVPVPFETIVRAAKHLSHLYTQEYWSKVDVVDSMRFDNIDVVLDLVSKWSFLSSSNAAANNIVVDGFVEQLSCLQNDRLVSGAGSNRRKNKVK